MRFYIRINVVYYKVIDADRITTRIDQLLVAAKGIGEEQDRYSAY
jgi:hypothetical protein